MKQVVIYPGRFQPMLSHHAEVYRQLQAQFPDSEVFIGTSDKVELPKSPFNFKEKQQIAAAHGIPTDRVLAVTRTYHQEDYAKYFNPAETIIVFAVGEKDLDRFPFNNVDPNTGLDMTVRGEAKPKYFQKINTLKASPKPMSERGYITLAPTIKIGDEVASASAFRDALKAAPDAESAKQIYTKQFGTYNDKVFNLIYNKIARADMSEQINILRKLAGLPLEEAAPVEFSGADAKAAKFLPPNASSAKMSIANRFPKGADVSDPAAKQEQFIQALLRSPEALLAEISERLDPKDNNSLAVDQKVSDIVQLMNQKDIGISGLPKDLKQFVLDLTVNAVKNMDLTAGDNSPAYDDSADEDEFKKENVDLNNIRTDYGVEEAKDEDEEDEDDDDWIPSVDDFEQEIAHGYRGRGALKVEGFSSESDMVLAKAGSGELDIYDVMTNPKNPAEVTAAKIIQQMYDDVSIDHHLHPDDDFEQILDIVADQLEADYGNSDADVREDDQIAEISDKTKDSYVKKASAEIGKHWDNSHDDADSARKYYNRKNTMRKISNEEVEGTAGNALDAAMLELRKLAGLR
jgi:ribosomal protein S24E